MSKRPWFLVRTKPSQESYAADNCKRQGCRTFLPLHHCEIRDRLVPLFPSYLFVQTDGRWHFIESTYGCLKVIRWSDFPDTIPAKVIRELRKRTNRRGIIQEKISKPRFVKGQDILIKDGPFRDFTAIFQEQDSGKRVHALLNLLGRSVSVTLRVRDVEPVAA